MDETNSLYEHIKNRLPTGYEFGDDGQKLDDSLVPNHKTSQQSIREDFEGDVGIFENIISTENTYQGYNREVAEVQIAVVTKNGDIEEAKKYLFEAFNNIKNNPQSSHIWVRLARLVNVIPLGKNSKGLQMVSMTVYLKYLVNNE